MTEEGFSRETLVALHETEGIGWKTVAELWEGRESRPLRPGIREAELRDYGLKPKVAAALAARLSSHSMEESLRRRRRAGIEVVTWADQAYPRRLRKIPDPPPVLYCKGRMELLGRPSVGVVGTRLATAYGRHVAETFSAAFSAAGLAVVSGLARGIDTAAHRGALQGDGGTIAVLGTPVDRIYPSENRQLYAEIADRGLLASEAPPGTPYHPGMFPVRNRIIAGLSLGVAVVEAPEGSGALITADRAIEQGRPVFAVPSPVTSPRGYGGLRMLRDGTADALIEPGDVIGRFSRHLKPRDSGTARSGDPSEREALPEPESSVFALLLDQPRSIEELAEASGLAFGPLHAVLLSLRIKRKITELPGSVYGAL